MTSKKFGHTILARWNTQSLKLKDELINYLVGLFGDTFNKRGVIARENAYSKYVKDQYRVHLQKIPRCENPPMILEREWKSLPNDAKEKTLKKEGKTLPGPTRYVIQ